MAKKSAIHEKSLAPPLSPRHRYKRQRDCLSPQQDVQCFEVRTSPEQDKKRICNYNNDITSSLSSSSKCKKIPILKNLNQTTPNNFQFHETEISKVLHKSYHPKINSKHVDMRFTNLENNWNKREMSEISVGNEVNNSTVVLQNTDSETSDEKIASGLTHTIQKPRLTLFNKTFDDSESHEENKTREVKEENNDCTGIPFVKPKKVAPKSGLKNAVIERTQKSKLALMLSGLRGELYQNSDLDEVDSASEKEKLKPSAYNSKINITPPSEATNNIPTLTTVTATTVVSTTSNVKAPTSVKTTLASTSLSPLVGLKLKPSSDNVSSILNANTTQKEASVLGSFPICTTSSSSISPLQACSSFETASKSTPTQVSIIPKANNTDTAQLSTSAFASNDKVTEKSENFQTPINKNVTQTPSICAAADLSRSNTTTSNTSSSFSVGKTFSSYVSDLKNVKPDINFLPNNTFPVLGTSSPVSAVSSAPVVFGASTASTSTSKPINTINFSTSSTPPLKSSAVEHKTVASSETPFSASTVSLANFNTKHPSTNSEMESFAISSKINENEAVKPFNAFGTNNSMQFKFNAKSSESGNQSNEKEFNRNSSPQIESQCLTTKAEGSSVPAFGNIPMKSDKNVFNPSIFGAKSVKSNTDANNSSDSPQVFTPTEYNNNNNQVNKSKSIPFSFVANTTAFAPTSSTSLNTNAGGFSFSSAILNTKGSGSTGEIDNLPHTFSINSPLASQNNFVLRSSSNNTNSPNIFGVPANKAENLTQGGFPFEFATPIKTSTFTFGSEKSSKSETINANNSSVGFSFSSSADSKQNVLSSNKPFSFGSPLPVQQKQPETTNIGNSFNIFGLADASKGAQPATFDFTSGSAPSNMPTNRFAPPISNVTTGPGDRLIRRATRRLQK